MLSWESDVEEAKDGISDLCWKSRVNGYFEHTEMSHQEINLRSLERCKSWARSKREANWE